MHEAAARATFERWCLERFPDIIYRAAHQGRDQWMTASQKVGFAPWMESEEFKKSSAQKKNRASSREDDKPSGTHAMGRISAVQYMERLAASEYEDQAPPIADFVHKDSFLGRKKIMAATQPKTRIDDNRLYYEVAGGPDKRGRIYGTGKAMDLYFDRASRHLLVGERASYATGLLTKMSQ